VLYEMLTGRRAFEGDNVSDTVAAILRNDPDWTRLPADTPFLVKRLLGHCLARDPRDRLADIHDARIEIAESLTAPAAAVVAPSKSRTRSAVWTGVGAGIVAIPMLIALAAGLIRVREAPAQDPVVRFTLPLPDGIGIQSAPTVSPDGRHIVFGAMVSGARSLWLRSLDTLEMRKLPGTENGGLPFWSPDSRRIGFFADGKLKTVNVAGGPVSEVCGAANGRGGTWGQHEVIVFSPGGGAGLLRVAAGGGSPVPATTLEGGKAITHRWPTFLSDGRHFVFLATTGAANMAGARLTVGSIDSTSTKELTAADSRALFAAPDLLLFLRGGTLMRQRFDLQRLDLVGDSVPVAENVAPGTAAIFGEVLGSVSNTGVLVYRSGTGGAKVRLAWVDRRGSATILPLQPDQYADPSLSPDGQQIALGLRDQSGDHIWVYDVARGTFGKRTFEGSNAFAIWSPDSQHITFTRGPGFGGPLLRIRADGSGKPETILPEPQTPSAIIATAWSADGRLAFGQGPDVMVREPDGTIRPALASPAMEREGRFSPDGRWISYRSNETGRDEIYVQGYPTGGKWQISTTGGAQAIWAASGRELFYKSANRMMVVPVELTPTFKPGTPRVLFEMPLPERAVGDPSRFGLTPDGTRFLILTMAPGQESSISPPLNVVLNWNQSPGSSRR
jgi:Tol biopolymer transport system component